MWGVERGEWLRWDNYANSFFFASMWRGGKDNGLMLRAQLLRKGKFLNWWETFGY